MKSDSVVAWELCSLVAESQVPVYLEVEGELLRLVKASRGNVKDGYIYLTFGDGPQSFVDEAQVVEFFKE